MSTFDTLLTGNKFLKVHVTGDTLWPEWLDLHGFLATLTRSKAALMQFADVGVSTWSLNGHGFSMGSRLEIDIDNLYNIRDERGEDARDERAWKRAEIQAIRRGLKALSGSETGETTSPQVIVKANDWVNAKLPNWNERDYHLYLAAFDGLNGAHEVVTDLLLEQGVSESMLEFELKRRTTFAASIRDLLLNEPEATTMRMT